MKKINNYILEKLKINKDSYIKDDNIYNKAYQQLKDMLCLTNDDESRTSLKTWIYDNKIHTLQGYMKHQKIFDDFTRNNHIIDKDKEKDLKSFYKISSTRYDNLLTHAVSLGNCLYKKKRYDGKYYEVRATKKYLAYRDLSSQEYIVIEGNPYGELG